MIRNYFLILLVVAVFPITAMAQNVPGPAPKTISGGVVNGKATSLPKPVYPPEAIETEVTGSVNVTVIIDREGNVRSAEAVSGPPLLRDSAAAAAKQAKFLPTTLEGIPVEVSGVIVYNFVIPEPGPEKPMGLENVTNPMALSLLMGIYKKWKTDAEFTGIIDGMFTEMSDTHPTFSVNGKFSEKTETEQTDILRRVKNILDEEDYPGAGWQYQVGDHLGQLLGQTFFVMAGQDEIISEMFLRDHLTEIKTLAASSPKGFPEAVTDLLNQLGNFADRDDLATPEMQKQIFDTLQNLFATISPD